ncbi:hypothetical protein NC653_022495 [Populus alba x Populus x berolinensis]|uniref:Uncharacterized protein n=2 Tax=Populus TaxID=3689 RepID=A0A4U5QH48_POPAL|nr:hypothetical protein NC653_022495 [Populus alba x Populus x berolinensis]TKS09369.1 hypothetical protein D5086_0000094960 [Populus alba]
MSSSNILEIDLALFQRPVVHVCILHKATWSIIDHEFWAEKSSSYKTQISAKKDKTTGTRSDILATKRKVVHRTRLPVSGGVYQEIGIHQEREAPLSCMRSWAREMARLT